MPRRPIAILLGFAGVAALSLLTCAELGATAVAVAGEGKGGPPPLVVDKKAPLLLEEPAKPDSSGAKKTKRGVADNAPCLVCHVNYKDEPLARQHADVKIGCVKCHGKSFAHRNDENNTTPPETMYPADEIDRACGKCHTSHNVPPAKVIARWQKRCPTKTDPKEICCTDCHGQHRLKIRTVRWDKKTGKLVKGK